MSDEPVNTETTITEEGSSEPTTNCLDYEAFFEKYNEESLRDSVLTNSQLFALGKKWKNEAKRIKQAIITAGTSSYWNNPEYQGCSKVVSCISYALTDRLYETRHKRDNAEEDVITLQTRLNAAKARNKMATVDISDLIRFAAELRED